MAILKSLAVPDSHFPYQDQRAFDLMCKAAKSWKPDKVIVLGDFIDNYSVSFHSKSPERRNLIIDEAKEAKKGLKQLEDLHSKEYVFISGNHEYRLDRYISEKAPNLHGVINTPQLLGLEKRWKYVPYKDYYKLGKLIFTHDMEKAGKYAIHSAVSDANHNIIIGHLHRLGVVYEGDSFGESHVGACFGWLGDVKHVDYKHGLKANREWHLGFGAVYTDTTSGYSYVQAIPIINYTCCLDGKVYKG